MQLQTQKIYKSNKSQNFTFLRQKIGSPTHVELLPQMDDAKQKEETTQRMF